MDVIEVRDKLSELTGYIVKIEDAQEVIKAYQEFNVTLTEKELGAIAQIKVRSKNFNWKSIKRILETAKKYKTCQPMTVVSLKNALGDAGYKPGKISELLKDAGIDTADRQGIIDGTVCRDIFIKAAQHGNRRYTARCSKK